MKRGVFQPNKTRDIAGLRFNNLTAVRFDHRDERVKGGQHYWLFRCDCGNEVVLRKNSVTSNNTTCCADCARKRKALVNTKHGGVGTRLYREWAGIIQRCINPKDTSWERYGAKGVTVCDEWLSFPAFREWAYANGYDDSLTIDRINPNGNYEPSNCRWASVREQANNKQGTLWVEYGGERMQLSYWADRLGIPYHTLYDRLHRYGWSVERAFTEPVRRAL